MLPFFTGHCGLDKYKYKIHKFMYAVQIQTSILYYSLIQASHGCSRAPKDLQGSWRVSCIMEHYGIRGSVFDVMTVSHPDNQELLSAMHEAAITYPFIPIS